MRAAPGAIDRVWIEDGYVRVRTINDLPPIGLAGTGLVSAVAALRKARMLDERGLFCNHERLDPLWWEPKSKGQNLILVQSTSERPAITLSQADVGEFQLAKGAVRAGITILGQKMDVTNSDIQRILLAGAFGSFMDAADALAADLLPDIPIERIESVGNAAGVGALEMLLSKPLRQKGVDLAQQIQYVELSVEPEFNRLFAKSLPFNQHGNHDV